MVFSSNDCDKFNQAVVYRINGNTTSEFMFRILAEVVPVCIEVDREEIDFNFSEDSHAMYTSQIVNLTNDGNAAAKYEWKIPEECAFKLEKQKGQVEPGETLPIEITYTPEGKVGPKGNRQDLVLKVQDGFDKVIGCHGICETTSCQIKTSGPEKNKVDFGEIPISSRKEQAVTIKNTCNIPVVFEVIQTFYKTYLQISPMRGKIPPRDARSLNFSFMCKEEM